MEESIILNLNHTCYSQSVVIRGEIKETNDVRHPSIMNLPLSFPISNLEPSFLKIQYVFSWRQKVFAYSLGLEDFYDLKHVGKICLGSYIPEVQTLLWTLILMV